MVAPCAPLQNSPMREKARAAGLGVEAVWGDGARVEGATTGEGPCAAGERAEDRSSGEGATAGEGRRHVNPRDFFPRVGWE